MSGFKRGFETSCQEMDNREIINERALLQMSTASKMKAFYFYCFYIVTAVS
jgi:hypothetical protein